MATTKQPVESVVVGAVYSVWHCRKGRFVFQVKSFDDEWVRGLLLQGKPRSCKGTTGKWLPGQHMEIRRCLATFTPLD